MPKKYKALKKSYGYQNRYWEEGQIAEVSDKEKKEPPKDQFELVGAPKVAVPAKPPLGKPLFVPAKPPLKPAVVLPRPVPPVVAKPPLPAKKK